MRTKVLMFATMVASIALADTLTLKNGQTVQGTYLGGDARRVRMAVADRVDNFDVNDISNLQFGGGPDPRVTGIPPREPGREYDRPPARQERAYQPPPAVQSGFPEIPSGTEIVIRMIDSVDSERDRVGQTFRASTEQPVMVNGETVIPRGADVQIKLANDKESGKLAGRTELTLDLMAVQIGGRMVQVDTADVVQSSGSRTGKTAKVVGGTAALGAVIGALAGGGKGAAIGAASGAGAGGAVQVLTKGQRVRIPSETRLSFTLQQPVRP